MAIQQITIIGTGLIGGSLALALKKCGFRGRIVGCDREAVLEQAKVRGMIDAGETNAGAAVRGSDVVVLATPVGSIIDLIEKIGPLLPRSTLLSDVGSTKAEIVARARDVFGSEVKNRFLAGHPMAGKEHSGVEVADAALFQDAVWIFAPFEGQEIRSGICGEYASLIEGTGARLLLLDAARHDELCAWLSHLPQMVSTGLASTLLEVLGDYPEASAIGGRALREMTRIAQSPYSMWRDIALTNTEHIQQALLRLEQRLAHIRENLRSAELREEFERGNRFRRE
ncbi:MAG TPA: prephenate dehydrogenase/arogenate dehydrogenase family protein [Terriglobales bacterium]|nr:prephenate dehydrogenase/arogenate dehydrogenase family protein [Terriglobales bacterium]